MGKRIRAQKIGRGSPTYRASKTGKIAQIKYPPLTEERLSGFVKDLVHESGRGLPLAHIWLNDGRSYYIAAPEGVYIGQNVDLGSEATVKVGNVLPLGVIPEGTMVCNIELRPGDGGKIARSSGTFATVVSHMTSKTTVKMPSKRNIQLPNKSRATVGVVAGGGRKEKPFIKAGEHHYHKKAKGHFYPKTKGVSMTAASHPHGGGRHRRPGKSTTVSRDAPPGKKVGLIAARSSGKKKRRRRRE